MAGPKEKSNWTETIVKVAGPLAKLSTPEGDWENSPLRLRFLHAGIRNPDARLLYFAAKTVLPLALAGLTYMALRGMSDEPDAPFLHPDCGPDRLLPAQPGDIPVDQVSPAGNLRDLSRCGRPDAGLRRSRAGAGRRPDQVADEIRRKSTALAEELHLTNLEIRAGGTREKSLRNLALRTGVEEIGTFATMLTQADKFGTSIGDSLRVFSDDLRHKRQIRAEESAAKVPTKMLFPLVICIFPAVIMVILGPAIIQIVRTILPMLSGGS